MASGVMRGTRGNSGRSEDDPVEFEPEFYDEANTRTRSEPPVKSPFSPGPVDFSQVWTPYSYPCDPYRRSVEAVLDCVSLKLTNPEILDSPRFLTDCDNMAAPPQLIFVDGSFAELAQEMADYIQVGDQVKPLLEKEQNEAALDIIVKASHYLNSVPEKEFTAAYNLLIHLVLQSKDPKKYLQPICGNLGKPITSSPTHGFTLASNALSTIFNLLEQSNPLRYNVFLQIVRFIKQHGQFDLLKPRLKNIDLWLEEWDTEEEAQRKLFVDIAEAASEANDEEESYHFLLKALGTFDRDDQEEITSDEAQKLSLRALRMALIAPHRFDFQDLRVLPTVQALSDSHPTYAQLLDIFTEQDLEDYNDFREEHEGWIEKEKLDHEKLQRKMRLLTFASLAASTPNREIPYANIAKALQVPVEDVEMWTIDVVRAKLVEGRLSQQQKVFLVHRTTYRVFGEKQWRELGTRVDQFKTVVDRLVSVVRKAQSDVDAQREREQQELDRKLANAGISDRPSDRRRQQTQQRQRTDDDD
ncbi:hypothetical protein QBC37DRAFT_393876 [Rhypophila decipiens]|uniref:Eukaryotic translation initiation factor 3 subunit M n=1 Tax=Rhypophila decipiens TaxID=261697 RepID=A0AAN6YKI2_9PEZI|nr:hypothetical protein QBC37DRAFT_393876 [Rhypophila decipiens]